MEKLVTSLEEAKLLKECGFPQEGCSHYWVVGRTGFSNCETSWECAELATKGSRTYDVEYFLRKDKNIFAAPTAAEVLERLPDGVDIAKCGGCWKLFFAKDGYGSASKHDKNLANAASAMYRHLAAAGMIKEK